MSSEKAPAPVGETDQDLAASMSSMKVLASPSVLSESDDHPTLSPINRVLLSSATCADTNTISSKENITTVETPERKIGLFDSLDKLFKLTAAGYVQRTDIDDSFEHVCRELEAICQAVIKLEQSDQVKCADEIGERAEFTTVLVPFMAQVYKGRCQWL